jgi:hypothetical protein
MIESNDAKIKYIRDPEEVPCPIQKDDKRPGIANPLALHQGGLHRIEAHVDSEELSYRAALQAVLLPPSLP